MKQLIILLSFLFALSANGYAQSREVQVDYYSGRIHNTDGTKGETRYNLKIVNESTFVLTYIYPKVDNYQTAPDVSKGKVQFITRVLNGKRKEGYKLVSTNGYQPEYLLIDSDKLLFVVNEDLGEFDKGRYKFALEKVNRLEEKF